MTAKETAIQDIKNDLKHQYKGFLAFRKSLNPIMGNIVSNYISRQQELSQPHWNRTSKSGCQLVATCLFSKSDSTVKYNNYTSYYK